MSAIVRSVVLGGAQLGMRYGIAGNHFLSTAAAFTLFNKAHYLGFRSWDLAQSYGCAEHRAGLWLRSQNRKSGIKNTKSTKEKPCTWKMASFNQPMQFHWGTKIQLPEPEALENARRQLQLRRRYFAGYARLSYILLHSVHPQKLAAQLRALECLRKDGERIGLSLYYPRELETLWREQERGNCPAPNIIQLPYSIADRRFAPYFFTLQASGVELQLRSLYLQGLLFAPKQAANPFFRPLAPLLNALQEWEYSALCTSQSTTTNSIKNRADLLLYAVLQYTHGQKSIFAPNQLKVVLGVSNAQELLLLYQSLRRLDTVFEKSPQGAALSRKLEEPLPQLKILANTLPAKIVVPALWPSG